MALFVGVDGGGTSTRCAVADGEKILGRGTSTGCNIVRLGEEAARMAIHEAVRGAFQDAGVDPKLAEGACIGVAGSSVPQVRLAIQRIVQELLSCPVLVVGDQEIAHQSVFNDGPGVLVISGTGSIAFGRNAAGKVARAGGHGLILGDEGSGHWIGRTAISTCLRSLDTGLEPKLLAAIVIALGVPTAGELIKVANAVPLAEFASLLPVILGAAENDDPVAVEVLTRAGNELSALACMVAARLELEGEFGIAMAGGVFEHSVLVRQAFRRDLQNRNPAARVMEEMAEPLKGALAMAKKARSAASL